MKTLLIGYGNPDRQDDGIALRILVELSSIYGWKLDGNPEDNFFPQSLEPDLWFCLQLVPEMAETLSQYQRVCFIDAHTGTDKEIQMTRLKPVYQPSALTHHLSPASLLSLCETLSGTAPEAVLFSIKGYRFGFGRELSPETEGLVPRATLLIQNWIQEIK